MTNYVAFLRGINVGGNKKVAMADLKKMLEGLKFKNVKTLLNSGNVVLETETVNREVLQEMIYEQFKKCFGFESGILVRTLGEIQKLVDADPFKGIAVTADIRLYVTFLSEKTKSSLKIPYNSPEKYFRILRASEDEVCSVLDLSKGRGSVDAMGILEKEYGKKVTTRNWNTVLKLLQH